MHLKSFSKGKNLRQSWTHEAHATNDALPLYNTIVEKFGLFLFFNSNKSIFKIDMTHSI